MEGAFFQYQQNKQASLSIEGDKVNLQRRIVNKLITTGVIKENFREENKILYSLMKLA